MENMRIKNGDSPEVIIKKRDALRRTILSILGPSFRDEFEEFLLYSFVSKLPNFHDIIPSYEEAMSEEIDTLIKYYEEARDEAVQLRFDQWKREEQ